MGARLRLLSFLVILVANTEVQPAKKAESAPQDLAPRVVIDEPASGWTGLKIVKLRGRVLNGQNIHEALLTVNSYDRLIPVVEGKFQTDVLLGGNTNYLQIRVVNEFGSDSKALKLMTENQRIDLQLVCNWDTDQTYIDLHITDPMGETVLWNHPHSKIGGVLTGYDIYGYGPQIFTLTNAVPGEYTIKINYYESGQGNPTMARVVVILYQGTEREATYVYPTLVHSFGEMITIGKFRID
jgi:uncharacterized protein YfaP (DUF2135 family)